MTAVVPLRMVQARASIANGEKRDETQEIVGRVDEPVEARLGEAEGGEELGGFLVFHFGEIGFKASADGHNGRVALLFERGEIVTGDGGG